MLSHKRDRDQNRIGTLWKFNYFYIQYFLSNDFFFLKRDLGYIPLTYFLFYYLSLEYKSINYSELTVLSINNILLMYHVCTTIYWMCVMSTTQIMQKKGWITNKYFIVVKWHTRLQIQPMRWNNYKFLTRLFPLQMEQNA